MVGNISMSLGCLSGIRNICHEAIKEKMGSDLFDDIQVFVEIASLTETAILFIKDDEARHRDGPEEALATKIDILEEKIAILENENNTLKRFNAGLVNDLGLGSLEQRVSNLEEKICSLEIENSGTWAALFREEEEK